VRRISALLVHRLCLLAAIVASAVLVVDYRNIGDPAFCGAGSGCMAVRLAPVTRTIGEHLQMPLPNFGLMAFVALFGLALYARTRPLRLALAVLAGIGGVAGAVLLTVQSRTIGAFCPWCVTVDVSAIGAAVAAVLAWLATPKGHDAASDPLFAPRERLGWSGLGAAAVILPFVWGAYPVVPPAPPEIAAEAVPGKLTIVEFTDFECPYCRLLNPVIEEERKAHPDQLALVRKMKPLSMHPGARPAALAYLCAPAAERDAVAQGLYTVDPDDLTPSGVTHVAEKAGVDGAAFAKCVDSADALAALAKDETLFEHLGAAGLPRTYVGDRVIMGYNPDRLRAVVEHELEGKHAELPLWALFGLLGAGFVAASWTSVRAARRGGSDAGPVGDEAARAE
jgi:uncharacterized membrane protein